MTAIPRKRKMIYASDERPPGLRLMIYGLQGVAMATYPIVWGLALIGLSVDLTETQLAHFATATIFTIGLASLAQAAAGHRMGLLSGPNIVPAFAMITAVQAGYPLPEIFGGLAIGSALAVLLGLSGLASVLRQAFTPLAMGAIVMMIGLGTASVGASFMAQLGPLYFVVAIVLGLGIGYIGHATSGFVSTISVLTVVAVGYLIAIVTGHLDWSIVGRFPLVSPPHPLALGLAWPRTSVLIPTVIAMLASGIQGVMNTAALAQVVEEPFDTARIRPIMSVFGLIEGLVPSLLSATPLVTYAVNAGFVAATRVVSRYPTMLAGLILMTMSAFGPLSGFLAAMPKPVAGAVLLGVAGPAIGIGANLWRTGTAQFGDTEAFIVGFSVFLAVGWTALPADFVAQLPGWVAQIFGNSVLAVLVYVVVLEQVVFRSKNTDAQN